jgi:LysR family transcriptional regulator, regulator for metE and metH
MPQSIDWYHETMDLEIRHLRLVAAIADTGSVTRAGERLHLSQSALSHQLGDIEDRLKTRLFNRVGKRMVITPAGDDVLRTAAAVLDLVGRTEERIKERGCAGGGVLRLSTQCYTCYHWLPPLLTEFRRQHPQVEVHVDAATSSPIAALVDGRIELAFVFDRFRDPRIAAIPLFQDDLVVVTSPQHRFAARSFIELEEFAVETLIIYPPREESGILKRILQPAGISPKSVQTIQLTEAIIELVKADLGIAVLARWAVAPYVAAGALHAARRTRAGHRRQWSALVLRESAELPFVKDFAALIRRHAPASRRRRPTNRILAFETPRARTVKSDG